MSRHYSNIGIFILAVVFTTACKIYYPVQENSTLVKVNTSFAADTAIKGFYKPYKDSLDKIMKVPLAELTDRKSVV